MGQSSHWAAVITGTAAVTAAALTVFFSSKTTRDVIREQSRQQAAGTASDARGAARILASQLITTSDEMGDLVGDGRFRPLTSSYGIHQSPADMRLVAARLSPRQWELVTVAIDNIEGLRRYVTQRVPRTQPRTAAEFAAASLSRHAVELIGRDMDTIYSAVESLRTEGDLGGNGAPTLKVDAAWKRILDGLHAIGARVPPGNAVP